MKVKRTYRCVECGARFSIVIDSKDQTEPDCPSCSTAVLPPPDRISAPAIIGTKSKAIDTAQQIISEDYGLSNMHDGMKEGDVGYITPPPAATNIDPRSITKPTMMWGGASPNPSIAMPGMQAMMAQGRGAAALAKAEGKSPMEMLHRGRPKMQAIPLNKGG